MEHVELQGIAIALLGTFNPAIFNPDWLSKQGVISDEEAQEARVDYITAELAQFTVGDLIFEVTAEKFVLHATAEPFVRAADIIADIFKDKLAHTPLTALGINYIAHFRVADWHQQTKLGRALAPLGPWGSWGSAFENERIEDNGGLVSLTMQITKLHDRKSGSLRATVQPSNRLKPEGTGVFMQINDQYDANDTDKVSLAEVCLRQFTPSLERSRSMLTAMSQFAWSL